MGGTCFCLSLDNKDGKKKIKFKHYNIGLAQRSQDFLWESLAFGYPRPFRGPFSPFGPYWAKPMDFGPWALVFWPWVKSLAFRP
jgi:hypothetical protein